MSNDITTTIRRALARSESKVADLTVTDLTEIAGQPTALVDHAFAVADALARYHVYALADRIAEQGTNSIDDITRVMIDQLAMPSDDRWSGRTANPVNRVTADARREAAADVLETIRYA